MTRVVVLLVLVGCSVATLRLADAADRVAGQGAPQPTQSVSKLLIINQHSTAYPQAAEQRGAQMELLSRHFTPATTLMSDENYSSGAVLGFDRVVVIGNDASAAWPPALLADAVGAARPILWIGHGLEQMGAALSETRVGFSAGFWTSVDLPQWVGYQDKRYPVSLEEYEEVRIDEPRVQVLAWYGGGGADPVPYILRDGNVWFVNGLPSLDSSYPDPESDAPTLIFADVLHDFFGTSAASRHQAVLRLEDVSVHVDPNRLIEIVDYLNRERIAFAIGVIPAQRFEDGSVVFLQERPALVRAIRYAQDRGATVILHGYHHTFGSGEDFEFWDSDRNAPLSAESWGMYAQKVEDGIRILRDAGIEPRLWETPHYKASPLAYEVFSHYFSYAFEGRDPVSWLPYPAGPDEFGQMLIPENIGYISGAEWTVAKQLERARLLRIVRDGWAVGFYHPSTIPIGELRAMVEGLRSLGYTFVDLRTIPMDVRFDYAPGGISTLATWFRDERALIGKNAEATVERRLGMSPIPGIPWNVIWLLGIILLFLFRLRQQWRPARVVARSTITNRRSVSSLLRQAAMGSAALLVALSLARAAEAFVLIDAPAVAEVSAPAGVASSASAASAGTQAETTGGWEISVYFTAVEVFYDGPRAPVEGCASLDCATGQVDLGDFPVDFVEAVKNEGTGRISTGANAGRYLNWAINVGYWLDSAPRDARGGVLEAYRSAAADVDIPYLTTFSVIECGRDVANERALPEPSCARLRGIDWVVRDRFSAGAVGNHVDLYIGEQDERDFVANSPRAVHTRDATLSLEIPARVR